VHARWAFSSFTKLTSLKGESRVHQAVALAVYEAVDRGLSLAFPDIDKGLSRSALGRVDSGFSGGWPTGMLQSGYAYTLTVAPGSRRSSFRRFGRL